VRSGKLYVMLLLYLVILLLPVFVSFGYEIRSFQLNVTIAGYVIVTHVIYVDDAPTVVELPLIGSPDIVVALDEKGNPIAYNITDNNITLYPVENCTIELTYATSTPIIKEEKYWSLKFNAFMPCKVLMPKDIVILDVNPLPERVITTNNMIVLYFVRGIISINYTIVPKITISPTIKTTSPPLTSSIGLTTSSMTVTSMASVESPITSPMFTTLTRVKEAEKELLITILIPVIIAIVILLSIFMIRSKFR